MTRVNLTYGYAINTMYGGDGNLYIQVRIPSVHGPYSQTAYRGKQVRRYVLDKDLPWYPSVILPHQPAQGEVVALLSVDDVGSSFLVVGLMGGSYVGTQTNLNI